MALKLDYELMSGSVASKAPATLDDVKDKVVGDINATIQVLKSGQLENAKRGWIMRRGGKLGVSVKYGVQPVYFAEGMRQGATSLQVKDEKEAVELLETVKEAIKQGELDAEIESAWKNAKAARKGKK